MKPTLRATTPAEHPEILTRRFLPPACLFRGAGNSASRSAHSRQYTSFTIVARSQSAPHPSHTFKFMRKSFIIPFQGVVLPGEPRSFSAVEWAHRLLANAVAIPQSSSGPIGQAASFGCLCSQYVVEPWEKSHPPCIAFHPWSRCSSSRGLLSLIKIAPLTFSVPVLESLKVIAFDKNSVNIYLSSGKLQP
jgi:hypothetical protein